MVVTFQGQITRDGVILFEGVCSNPNFLIFSFIDFFLDLCVCVCVCERERERQRERLKHVYGSCFSDCAVLYN